MGPIRLGRAAEVLRGGSGAKGVKSEFGFESAGVSGVFDFGDWLGSRLALGAPDGGNIGTPGRFAEPAPGDPFSICSS